MSATETIGRAIPKRHERQLSKEKKERSKEAKKDEVIRVEEMRKDGESEEKNLKKGESKRITYKKKNSFD